MFYTYMYEKWDIDVNQFIGIRNRKNEESSYFLREKMKV